MKEISKVKSVQIFITGAGSNTWVSAIPKKSFNKITKCEVGDYSSLLDMAQSEALSNDLVCWGLDANNVGESVVIKISDGKKQYSIEQVIYVCSGQSFDEACSDMGLSSSDKCMEMNEDDFIPLGEDFDFKKSQHLVFETNNWQEIILSATIPLNDKFNISDLKLLVKNMDVQTNLTKASYDLGLLGVEKDIVGVIYKGKKFLFECTSNMLKSNEITVVSKTNGEWSRDLIASMQLQQ